MNIVIKKLNYWGKNTYVFLIIIGLAALSIRLYFFPYGVPITEDGLFYFRYATDTSILGHFPSTSLANNGWPLFVSVFFSIFHSNNFLDYMTLQRLLSVSISVLTIIPVYLLVSRFFEPKYALIGTFLFAFEPRTIQNSLLGITEPLYILLVTLSLYFFLSKRTNVIYLSFSVAALCAQIRYEGIVLFFIISIMFFVRQKKERKTIIKYSIAFAIFIITILPMSYVRTITIGSDGITDGVISGGEVYAIEATSNQENMISGILSYVFIGLQALIKYLGWEMIPYFIFFVPFGIFLMLKKRNNDNFTIIFAIIVLSIPALYAYSRGIQETRYLYVLHPIFCILSIFAIKFLHDKIRKILLIIVLGVVISSVLFLTIKSTDYEHEREAFEIAKHIPSSANSINGYYPESKYVRITGMLDKFPVLNSAVSFGPKVLDTDYQSLQEFIEKNREDRLDYLVVDGKIERPVFLNDIFINDKGYPYLTKVFDSIELGYKYHVKMYKIDYERFDLIYNKNN